MGGGVDAHRFREVLVVYRDVKTQFQSMHLRQADNEGEKRRIRDRKGLTLQDVVNLYLSDQQNASGASQAISGGCNSTKRTAGDADNPPQAKRVRRDDIGDVVGDARQVRDSYKPLSRSSDVPPASS